MHRTIYMYVQIHEYMGISSYCCNMLNGQISISNGRMGQSMCCKDCAFHSKVTAKVVVGGKLNKVLINLRFMFRMLSM